MILVLASWDERRNYFIESQLINLIYLHNCVITCCIIAFSLLCVIMVIDLLPLMIVSLVDRTKGGASCLKLLRMPNFDSNLK